MGNNIELHFIEPQRVCNAENVSQLPAQPRHFIDDQDIERPGIQFSLCQQKFEAFAMIKDPSRLCCVATYELIEDNPALLLGYFTAVPLLVLKSRGPLHVAGITCVNGYAF